MSSHRRRVRKPRLGTRNQFDGMSDSERRQLIELRDTARERSRVCQMPHCNGLPLMNADVSCGLCLHCAFHVVDAVDALSDEVEADKERLAMRERRVKKQLHEHYLGEQERERRRQQPGWIYYLLIDGRIKIGYSTDVKKRLRQYPPDSPLLALHPGTKKLEQEMHAKFAGAKAAAREWFLDTPELRDHIKDVIEQFGEPDRGRYEHRGQHRERNLRVR